MKKKIIVILLIIIMIATFVGCDREATKVSYNISKEADNFSICREIIVINVRDGSVLYTLKGFFFLYKMKDMMNL